MNVTVVESVVETDRVTVRSSVSESERDRRIAVTVPESETVLDAEFDDVNSLTVSESETKSVEEVVMEVDGAETVTS